MANLCARAPGAESDTNLHQQNGRRVREGKLRCKSAQNKNILRDAKQDLPDSSITPENNSKKKLPGTAAARPRLRTYFIVHRRAVPGCQP